MFEWLVSERSIWMSRSVGEDCDRDQYKYVTIHIRLCDRDQYSVGKWRIPSKSSYFLEQYGYSSRIPVAVRSRQMSNYRCSTARSERRLVLVAKLDSEKGNI
ncbi:hypothetical protein HAX54_044790 [Datura stramonium]|uniref:Uncharacterized protein n=1 Tax=Datura stramonium TaxID=4076 RepID=A0ABS8WJ36_DATST|nr:hypothetical protein [Datura stramonium]